MDFTHKIVMSILLSSNAFFSLISSDPTQSSLFSYACNTIFNSANSVTNSLAATIINATCDEAALWKIGWPPNHYLSGEERKKRIIMYEKNLQIRNYDITNIEEIKDVHLYNERRRGYLNRVYLMLPNRPDNLEIAKHCLEWYSFLMDDTHKVLFLNFIAKKSQESQEISQWYNGYISKNNIK